MDIDEDDDIGEDIWNAFSWRSHISRKINLMQKHFEELSFPESYKQMIEFFDTYFLAFLDEDNRNIADRLPTKLKNSNVPRVIVDSCFFTFLEDSKLSALQELKLLELICTYYRGEKLDVPRYLVFECIFGSLIDDEPKLQDVKVKFLGELLSMAAGTECTLILDSYAILLQKVGQSNKLLPVISHLINDYCVLVPFAFKILENVIQASPLFSSQIVELLSMLYSFHEKPRENSKDADDDDYPSIHQSLPPTPLLNIIGSWLTSNPKCFTQRKMHGFTTLPSIYTSLDENIPAKMSKCPITGLLSWSVLSPLFAGVKIGSKVIDAEEIRKASSFLHYGILNYFALHSKGDTSGSGDEDELEPGEVSEEKKPIEELIFESDIRDVIAYLDETVENLNEEITKEKVGESIDRLAQIIQVSKWSGCFLPSSKKFKHALKKVPKTKLFSKVIKSL